MPAPGAAYLTRCASTICWTWWITRHSILDLASCRYFIESNIRRGSFGMGLMFPPDHAPVVGVETVRTGILRGIQRRSVGFQTQYVQTVNSQASAAVAAEFVQRVWQQANRPRRAWPS